MAVAQMEGTRPDGHAAPTVTKREIEALLAEKDERVLSRFLRRSGAK